MHAAAPRGWARPLTAAWIVAVTLLGPLTSPVQAGDDDFGTPAVVHLLMAPSLVRVQSSWEAPAGRGGQPGSHTTTCTGFVVHPDGYLVTAGHCVQPPSGATSKSSVTVTIGDGVADHTPVTAQVLEAHTAAGNDVALLKVPARNLVPVTLADDVDVSNEQVVVSGFLARITTITKGDDASKLDGELRTVAAGAGATPAYRLGQVFDEGIAGAPVAGIEGVVLGVASTSDSSATPAFTAVTPVPRIRALLRRHDVANVLGPAGTTFREGMQIFGRYDWRNAVAPLEQALAINPNLPTVERLKGTASYEALWQGGGSRDDSGDSFPWIPVMAAGAGFVIVGGFLLRRRRRRLGFALSD